MKNVSKLAAISFAAIALLAQPAVASVGNDNSTVTVSSQSGTAPRQAAADKKKICAVTEITGSRMPKRVCLTKEEWAAEGEDFGKQK